MNEIFDDEVLVYQSECGDQLELWEPKGDSVNAYCDSCKIMHVYFLMF